MIYDSILTLTEILEFDPPKNVSSVVAPQANTCSQIYQNMWKETKPTQQLFHS